MTIDRAFIDRKRTIIQQLEQTDMIDSRLPNPFLSVPKPSRLPRYSKEAVGKAIAASNRSGRKIGAREAKAIHALLKGRE